MNPNPNSASTYEQKIGGDGFEAAWNYTNPDNLVGSSQFNRFRRSTNGGISWSLAIEGLEDTGEDNAPFISRLENHKLKPNVLLAIGQKGVWRSNNFGENWFLQPLANKWVSSSGVSSSHRAIFSRANPDIIWAGGGMTSERSLHVSRNGGVNYNAVSNIEDVSGSISGLATHPMEEETAYVLFSLAESGKVFRTRDLGLTWEELSGFGEGTSSTNGFPNVKTHTLLVMPNDPETIWVGTDIGVIESNDDGESWHIQDSDLPSVAVYKLKAVDDQIIAATHGRGIWSTTIDGLQWPVGLVAGIEDELEELSISLYPNPAQSSFTLVYGGMISGPATLSIYDNQGREVKNQVIRISNSNGEIPVDISGIAGGIHIVNLSQGERSLSDRIIINH